MNGGHTCVVCACRFCRCCLICIFCLNALRGAPGFSLPRRRQPTPASNSFYTFTKFAYIVTHLVVIHSFSCVTISSHLFSLAYWLLYTHGLSCSVASTPAVLGISFLFRSPRTMCENVSDAFLMLM